MPLSKKGKKKPKKKLKKEKHVNQTPNYNSPIVNEERKEFYLDQINSLEPRLIRYVYIWLDSPRFL